MLFLVTLYSSEKEMIISLPEQEEEAASPDNMCCSLF